MVCFIKRNSVVVSQISLWHSSYPATFGGELTTHNAIFPYSEPHCKLVQHNLSVQGIRTFATKFKVVLEYSSVGLV